MVAARTRGARQLEKGGRFHLPRRAAWQLDLTAAGERRRRFGCSKALIGLPDRH